MDSRRKLTQKSRDDDGNRNIDMEDVEVENDEFFLVSRLQGEVWSISVSQKANLVSIGFCLNRYCFSFGCQIDTEFFC